MVAGLAAGAALAATAHLDGLPQRLAWLTAAVLVQLRLLANMLDGMVAIGSGTVSPRRGAVQRGARPGFRRRRPDRPRLRRRRRAPPLGYLAALAAVFTAYVRALGKAAGAGQEFAGPIAKPQRMWAAIGCAAYCGLAPADWHPGRSGCRRWCWASIAVGSLFTALRRLRPHRPHAAEAP